ncbi:uncharacterized protein LOC108672131 [Hyalella azteca]|uniref:Uncharacterized protein LOC108672131 n=1 Tax=Hyalella azteca TaxID=294128 RepID=A0A8B7NNI3_HYAAZ|nr:uncharacterized protein LOC108672131 [Hyalella azteca]
MRRKYCRAVINKLDTTRNESDNIEDIWEQQKNAYTKAAEEVLGYKKRVNKPWISNDTWRLIDERRTAKVRVESTRSERIKNRMREEYREKDREVKRSVREDKRMWMSEKAAKAQNAAENGRQKELYSIVKRLTGQSTSTRQTAAVKSVNGELLKSKEARMARWKEHFQEVLNREAPEEPPEEVGEEGQELDISVEAPDVAETRAALKTLRNGGAPSWADEISAEMLKADTERTSLELKWIFDLIWDQETVPTQWTKGLICKIPKRGNLQDCGNWRGVTLLPLASKVLSKILINRIQGGVDTLLRKEQAGFRRVTSKPCAPYGAERAEHVSTFTIQ